MPDEEVYTEDVEEETVFHTGNSYLDNPKKSLTLLRCILAHSETDVQNQAADALRSMILHQLLPLLAAAKVDGELQMTQELHIFLNRLSGSISLAKLNMKTVVGIGGRFSAGKSCFINSLMGKDTIILPEGQLPTTSISTYITHGSNRTNIISNAKGYDIPLDDDAVIALNHQFYQKYGIGFSKYIRNILLETPRFQYEHIAILDTPGYNKYDANKKQEASDNEKARAQLKAVDYIIWLTDSENGTIKEEDLSFLDAIAPRKPILFVINKADKRLPSDMAQIIDESKSTLDEYGINYDNVVGYSSHERREVLSENAIQTYLSKVEAKAIQTVDVYSRVSNLCQRIREQLQEQKKAIEENIHLYQQAIWKNTDLKNVKSVLFSYHADNANNQSMMRWIEQLDQMISELEEIQKSGEDVDVHY